MIEFHSASIGSYCCSTQLCRLQHSCIYSRDKGQYFCVEIITITKNITVQPFCLICEKNNPTQSFIKSTNQMHGFTILTSQTDIHKINQSDTDIN